NSTCSPCSGRCRGRPAACAATCARPWPPAPPARPALPKWTRRWKRCSARAKRGCWPRCRARWRRASSAWSSRKPRPAKALPPHPPKTAGRPGCHCSAASCATCCWPSWTCASNPSRGCSRPLAAADKDKMKTSHLGTFVFVLGLAAVCWVGLGYLGSNLPALLVTLLIAALYLVGAWELYRYRQATGSLHGALDALDAETPPALPQWLQGLHPSLRS